MIYGTVAASSAEGAVLVHSVRVGERTFRKGRTLDAGDVQALVEARIEAVVVIRYEAGDVPEDEAARRLAEPLVGPGVAADGAFTGRVNLRARHAGVLRLDQAAIDAVNHLDEALTIGTLEDYAPVAEGQLIATIKIIPFAAPAAALEAAVARLRESPSPFRVASFRGISAFLIQTTLPTVKESVLDKTAAITKERLVQVGGRLLGEQRCAHTAEAVAAAVAEAPSVDVLLIAGASAITDRRDVLPAGIEAAGGVVEHFGMPVDPGNLLLFAKKDGRPVVGLPGCARSPKLNGFDWVLQRLGAGLEVDRRQIMAMGVGGLLAEIPTRPQPREIAPPPDRPQVAVLVLAAGQSRRMGRLNKLVQPLGTKPMVAFPVDAALASKASEVVVVTGHAPRDVETALAGRTLRFVHNPRFDEGLSTSLQAGIKALGPHLDGAIVCLGDMPRITAQHLDRLIDAFEPEAGHSLVVPTVDGKRGNPVLWGRRHFQAIQDLAGDVGARHLIGQNESELVEVPMADDAALIDIDTQDALERARSDER
ncbi:MAG: 4-diphosphocytidyl-2C-methyl-D-erythritol kinase [Geminicoccaceae bacterium]|nr:MAG: 4-diphosphocytidyl-2C-methyl-D-erythritol kinase [Geminicoccaceae bacterium]